MRSQKRKINKNITIKTAVRHGRRPAGQKGSESTMKWYHRALSGVLAASMGVGLLGSLPHAAAASSVNAGKSAVGTTSATGEIQATIRLDYPISTQKLQEIGAKVTLLQQGQAIATGDLSQNGALVFSDGGKATGTVSQRTTEGTANYIDLDIRGLSAEEDENAYQLKFEADGFKTYESEELKLSQYSKGIVLGTGDATFTQGDLDGDGQVDEADIQTVKNQLNTTDRTADLNGDGKVDISDLAAITMASGASGEAQLFNTAVITAKVVDTQTVAQAITDTGTVEVKDGDVSSLFTDDGQTVTLVPMGGSSALELPIPLAQSAQDTGVEMEQVSIVSSTANPVEKGTVVAELVNGETIEVPFDQSTPDGVHAIQLLDDGRKTVTISLGQRVPVKKITIKVEIKDNQPVVVEQIKFVQDIVPEEPAVENVQVKNVKATPGAKQVTLTWDTFPNITGYKVYYGTSADKLTSTLETEQTTCTIENLENLKTYYFAVAPISNAGGQTWEGGKSAVVSATPQPNSVPDKPDAVTVTPGDTYLTVTWKPGKDTVSSRVQYRVKGEGAFTVLPNSYQTSATITGLENDVTYEVQVFGVNSKGNGPVSLTAEGTPKLTEIEGPELPSVNRLDAKTVITSATYPTNNTDTRVSKGTLPGSVYDGDYRTSWIASVWYKSRAFTFNFDKSYEMNYLIYVPDQGKDVQNNNGKRYRDYFTRFDLTINGQKVDASKVSFEKAKDNAYFIVKFPKSMVNTITVEGVQWDGAGNISLSEIAFYEYGDLDDSITALFANDSHTALNAGVDQNKINELRTRASDADAYYVNREVLLDELDNAQQLLEKKDSELTVRTGFASRTAAADREYGQSASALQPLGVSALSNQSISLYVEGVQPGDSLKLVQWQQYSETSATTKTYDLTNGRNRIWLSQIGNSGSGERGGSLYIEYNGSNADGIKIQVRDTSANKSVVTAIPYLNLQPDQWYGKNEEERKAVLRPYAEALKAYVPTLNFPNEGAKKTNTKNVTEIATPSVLLSLPANQVLTGLGGANASVDELTNQLYRAIAAWEQLIFLANKTQGIISADQTFDSYQYPMQTRQNIRFSRLFSGAFMFAAGSYVGIDYNETRAMVTGYPLGETGAGGIDADDVNGLYGWGIAHEVGHNMDKIGYAEITNNIYSLVAQTADTENMTGPSRLEGMYPDIFNKTALGKPGQAGNVFVQLGMYWQLHLAYDGKGNALKGAGSLDFFNAFFKKWKEGAHSDAPSKDDRIALIASEVTQKNLTEFFTRWGMELSESTKSTLSSYGQEDREIWYLSDQSRRDRLADASKASLTASLAAEVKNDTEVALTIKVSGDADRVQGYEIVRNGSPIAFLMGNGETTQTYTDSVGAANNMALSYSVRVIDKLGYEADTAKASDVRISYDKTISSSKYEIIRDSKTGNILITVKDHDSLLSVAGIKLTGSSIPSRGTLMVLTSDEIHELPKQEVVETPMVDLVPANPIVPEDEEQSDENAEITTETQPETTPVPPEQNDQTEAGAEDSHHTDGSEQTEGVGTVTEPAQTEDKQETTVTETEEAHQDQTAGTASDAETVELENELVPLAGLGEVTVQGNWTVAKMGSFTENEAADSDAFLTYFNKPGAKDTRIWMYDAKQIAISGIPSDVALEDIHLLDYPGDNIAFTEGASIGVLGQDYTYETTDGKETIPEGTIVITGSYRGDPLYNSVRVVGKMQSMQPGSSAAPTVSEQTLEGETLLFAEIPEDGAVSTISDGFFLFIPKDQETFKQVNEDHEDNHGAGNKVIIELKAQMWRSTNIEGTDYRLTSDTVFISVPRYESMPSIILAE